MHEMRKEENRHVEIVQLLGEFTELEKQNEEQPYKTDDEVTHIVFVLHGIRDLGRWSAAFETRLREAFQSTGQKLAVVSSRYAYFGMGPFLFRSVRQKYVRWFMSFTKLIHALGRSIGH